LSRQLPNAWLDEPFRKLLSIEYVDDGYWKSFFGEFANPETAAFTHPDKEDSKSDFSSSLVVESESTTKSINASGTFVRRSDLGLLEFRLIVGELF
jgi:hypothetical protein